MMRRVSFIRVAQQVGLSLDEIRSALGIAARQPHAQPEGLGAAVDVVAAPARRADRTCSSGCAIGSTAASAVAASRSGSASSPTPTTRSRHAAPGRGSSSTSLTDLLTAPAGATGGGMVVIRGSRATTVPNRSPAATHCADQVRRSPARRGPATPGTARAAASGTSTRPSRCRPGAEIPRAAPPAERLHRHAQIASGTGSDR